MTDIIYEREAVREAIIWPSFQYNGPFNATQEVERAICVGLYANTYLYGHDYLKEIEAEDLARLVDTYNSNIAMLTTDEVKTVLDIAAKRYVEQIDQQIHDENLTTRQKKIDALDAEYDVREDALEADYQAIVTQQAKVQLARDRAAQKIKDLKMRADLESVAQQLVAVEITEQKLRAARADLAVIEAGLKGLDIQLAITQAGIDQTNTDLQITNAENEVDEIGIRVSETEVAKSGVDLDITNAGINLSKSVAAGERIKVDTKGVAVRVAETDLQVVETEAREHQIGAEISKIDADTARLKLVDSELAIIQSDKTVVHAENELLVQEKYLINSQEDNVEAETTFIEDQQDSQEDLDEKTQDHDQSEHDFDLESSEAETEFKDGVKDKKVAILQGEKTQLVDDMRIRKFEDAEDKIKIADIRADAQEAYREAAVRAAQMLAEANLVTTLTHSVGEGSSPTPTTQNWNNVSSL